MENATITNLIAVRPSDRRNEGLGRYLTIDIPNGWDDCKKICKKVIEYQGVNYKFTGWNSDRNECFFVETSDVARIKK